MKLNNQKLAQVTKLEEKDIRQMNRRHRRFLLVATEKVMDRLEKKLEKE